jgi:hypothetical protein
MCSKYHNTQRLLSQPIVESWKGSGIVKGLLSREGVHFLGWDRLRGMRGCEVELLLELVPWAFPFFECCMTLVGLVREPFPWWSHSPNSGVTHY